jgi:enoyl-CoA hydratase
MEFIKTEQRDYVLLLTIDRQSALNALNVQVLKELKDVLGAIDLGTVRCVIITGAGEKAFVAGADIASMSKMTKQEGEEFGLLGNGVFRMIERLPVPVIAAVNGYALGGGCELAMACDIRLASENAVFSQPEVGLGITPGFGGTQRLPRLIGSGKAKELLFTCDRLNAEKALNIGLVNAVYPKGELLEKTFEMANKIAKNAPLAVQATKLAVDEGLNTDIDLAIRIEAMHFGSCFETQDQQEAMSAMLEKRKPEPFKGV